MPAYPVGGGAHIDVPLSNLAVAAFNTGATQFIGDQLLPSVGVAKQSDKYYILEPAEFFAAPYQNALRAPKTKARTVEFRVSSSNYFSDNYALANENALEDLANADMAIQLRQNSVNLVVTQLRRAQEIRIANLLTTAANMGSGTTLSGTSLWSDYVNSDPYGDVTTGHAFIRSQTGLIANTAVMDWDTMQIIRRHPDVLEHFKYTDGGFATMAQLQEYFRVSKILVGQTIYNQGKEGQVASMTNVWGKNFLLAHVMPGTSLQTQTLGLRFNWRPAGFAADFSVERRVVSGAGTQKVEIVEAGHFQDEKIVAPDLGYLISTTVA